MQLQSLNLHLQNTIMLVSEQFKWMNKLDFSFF